MLSLSRLCGRLHVQNMRSNPRKLPSGSGQLWAPQRSLTQRTGSTLTSRDEGRQYRSPTSFFDLTLTRPTLRRYVWSTSKFTLVKNPGLLSAIAALPTAETSSTGPSITLLLSALFGLPLALWAYKCLMMVVFQRKIIYMSYVPMGARTERLDRKDPALKGLHCEELEITSTNNVKLRGLLLRRVRDTQGEKQPGAIVIYLQGNAGNPLGRLPLFRVLLGQEASTDLAILAVAPRSYWLSSSKTPTEAGIKADYLSVLRYAQTIYPNQPIVLLGHSLGASVSVCLLADLPAEEAKQVRGLIIENAFSSIPDMVRTMYSSKWNPYHYLAPLVWDKWDALGAMRNVRGDSALGRVRLCVMSSEMDELVPFKMGEDIYEAAVKSGKFEVVERVVIEKALHEDAWRKVRWGKEIISFIRHARQIGT